MRPTAIPLLIVLGVLAAPRAAHAIGACERLETSAGVHRVAPSTGHVALSLSETLCLEDEVFSAADERVLRRDSRAQMVARSVRIVDADGKPVRRFFLEDNAAELRFFRRKIDPTAGSKAELGPYLKAGGFVTVAPRPVSPNGACTAELQRGQLFTQPEAAHVKARKVFLVIRAGATELVRRYVGDASGEGHVEPMANGPADTSVWLQAYWSAGGPGLAAVVDLPEFYGTWVFRRSDAVVLKAAALGRCF